jgi:hypothetical protein
VNALVRFELSTFLRAGQWIWPTILFVLGLIGLTAVAINPAHAAYGLIAPVLLALSAWFGWLISSALPEPVFHIAIVSVGGRERALAARWLSVVLACTPMFVLAALAAEIARQGGSNRTGIWWGGIGSHLLATLFGVGLGVLLGARLTQRDGRPVPLGESTPKAALAIVLLCGAGALPYAGLVFAVLFLLATIGVTVSALTT